MNTSIKLCGFKNIDDIIFATSLDINYLGMIFVENLPRSIDCLLYTSDAADE